MSRAAAPTVASLTTDLAEQLVGFTPGRALELLPFITEVLHAAAGLASAEAFRVNAEKQRLDTVKSEAQWRHAAARDHFDRALAVLERIAE